MYYRIWVASQRFHGKDSLTYSCETQLQAGQIVSIPLQRRQALGIVAGVTPKPGFTTKPVDFTWPFRLPPPSLKLLEWLIHYYPASLGTIAELFTPPNLVKKISEVSASDNTVNVKLLPILTAEQAQLIQKLDAEAPSSVLLHGDTGSGKTRIYLELAYQAVRAGKSVIVLTPEIGLTEQLRESFATIFGSRVIVTHSDMKITERRKVWEHIAGTKTPLIIIGPRSAIFSPLKNIGLIVMDEAHDSAYKQEQAPYYQTSRVAAQLAHEHHARFIMGTATPSVSDYFTFVQKNLPILRMKQQALTHTSKTDYQIIDQREKANFRRSPWLSEPLLDAIDEALKRQEQALLFLNRRGSARLVLCDNCGWQAMCPHCDVALTYHQDQHNMRCHSCNFSDTTPNTCPVCGATELIFRSIGTKALESEINRLYPGSNLARFDRDTEKALRLSNQYQDLRSGKINILIGTQTVAKGFDLPKLSVVGIVQADSGLQIPDYTSDERTYQLISQVSGRIGRGHLPGKLFIQTYRPDSPLITDALGKNYQHFYETELAQRQIFRFPPYYFLLKITCSRATSASAKKACKNIADLIVGNFGQVIVEGPTPRFIEKMSGRYAWHLVIKSRQRPELLKIIALLPGTCTYDLDPSDLL